MKDVIDIKINIADLEKKLSEAKKALEIREKMIKRNNLDEQTIRVAEFLHKKLCTYNHTDCCEWYYDDWSKVDLESDKYVNARTEYYKKAQRLLQSFNENAIYLFIDILKK